MTGLGLTLTHEWARPLLGELGEQVCCILVNVRVSCDLVAKRICCKLVTAGVCCSLVTARVCCDLRNNIILARLDFGSLFERWYQSRAVLRSPWPAVHMSDAARIAVLLHHGGIYLDTDVIVRRSLAALDDGAGLESERAVASGVLKFSRDSAVPRLLASCLTEGYDPYNWGHNGPGVVTEVLIEGCGLRDPPLTTTHCGNYTIYGR
ncbi:lactosylceramide 4-alpha-galactosyltransferase-like [Pollicipes pollicipes]|uniref:lactosylceramide 4-alpha-galactosyltransferase-like n=1 Tax=Pollicipes pollicipes TaxID=41117 RepID=UPI001885153C|nr:lactosylceramide 4-alpha-galactosyltransferase-like [Pollicipes pollicipes]